MSNLYPIKQEDGSIVMMEPVVDAWYCASEIRYDTNLGEEYESSGLIAKYVGNDEFYDEDDWCNNPVDMNNADYLVRQK